MPEYVIRVIPVGQPIEDYPFAATRDEGRLAARELARGIAEQAFPDCRITGSAKTSDAFVAFRGGEYAGTVSVERAD